MKIPDQMKTPPVECNGEKYAFRLKDHILKLITVHRMYRLSFGKENQKENSFFIISHA